MGEGVAVSRVVIKFAGINGVLFTNAPTQALTGSPTRAPTCKTSSPTKNLTSNCFGYVYTPLLTLVIGQLPHYLLDKVNNHFSDRIIINYDF